MMQNHGNLARPLLKNIEIFTMEVVKRWARDCYKTEPARLTISFHAGDYRGVHISPFPTNW